ncbi:MAG: hypothetical protein L6Q40_07430 [Azonexus sp.]|nr:hypothetical protein [Azonexus sp.]
MSVKSAVVGGIVAAVLVSQLINGFWQYRDRAEMGRQNIQNINEAVLQPVMGLATTAINGGNQMMLTDGNAAALFKATGVRYLKLEGMSQGTEKPCLPKLSRHRKSLMNSPPKAKARPISDNKLPR